MDLNTRIEETKTSRRDSGAKQVWLSSNAIEAARALSAKLRDVGIDVSAPVLMQIAIEDFCDVHRKMLESAGSKEDTVTITATLVPSEANEA